MTVRAKFEVTEKTQTKVGYEVELMPVTGGSEENESFYKWTPAGSIKLSTINEAAATRLEVGKQYYVDFIPAE